MKRRYEEYMHAAGQLLAEGGKGYTKPDFKRLVSIVMLLLVEVIIVLHIMRRSNYIGSEAYQKLYEQCEDLRKMLVRLKDY